MRKNLQVHDEEKTHPGTIEAHLYWYTSLQWTDGCKLGKEFERTKKKLNDVACGGNT